MNHSLNTRMCRASPPGMGAHLQKAFALATSTKYKCGPYLLRMDNELIHEGAGETCCFAGHAGGLRAGPEFTRKSARHDAMSANRHPRDSR